MSSRNSGVIHAGMYYPENSLKAKFCVEGNKLLYEYANQKNIAHKKTGKFIISTRKSELHKLDKIYEQGLANGVIIKKCSRNEIKNKEPSLNVNAGLYSPETGIIDVPEFVTALEGDIQHKGGIISFNTEFLSAKKINGNFSISCKDQDEFEIKAKTLINASGLNSDFVSKNIKGYNFHDPQMEYLILKVFLLLLFQ